MRIAITGATGFIGSYTVVNFIQKGYEVIALGRNLKKLNNIFDESVLKKETDYSYESLLEVLKSADAVVHLAGKRAQRDLDPLLIEPYIKENVLLTQNLLKATQDLNISRFCQSSSIAVYSNANSLPFNESHVPFAISVYGISKLTCEHLANLFSTKTNIKVTNLRFSSVFGIGEKTGLVFTDYINLAKQGKTLEIWGKGETSVEFLYIKDAVNAIHKALLPESLTGTYNIGAGKAYSIVELAKNINYVFNNEGNLTFMPEKKEGGYKIYMDIEKAKTNLNWRPEWSLINSLKDMKESY